MIRLRVPLTVLSVLAVAIAVFAVGSLTDGPAEIFRHWWSALAVLCAVVLTVAAIGTSARWAHGGED